MIGVIDEDYNAYHLVLQHEELNIKGKRFGKIVKWINILSPLENRTLVRDMQEVDEDGFFDLFNVTIEYKFNIK